MVIPCPKIRRKKIIKQKLSLGSGKPKGITLRVNQLLFPYLINFENAWMRVGFWIIHFHFIYFGKPSSFLFSFILFLGWIIFETMKGLHISCPFNENYGESKLFMNFNLGEEEGGNFTAVGFHQIIQKW